MSHPTDMRYNQSLPMQLPLPEPEVGNPIRRGDTVTNIDPLGNVIPEHGGYTVAPGLAAQAAREAEGPKPATSDMIAQDAAPAQYPAGAPKFRPLHRLGFLEKASAFDLLDVIQEAQANMPVKGEGVSGKRAAAMYRVLAKMDDFLASVAVNTDEYLAWDGRHDDVLFSQTWAAYQGDAQPGEAGSSSS